MNNYFKLKILFLIYSEILYNLYYIIPITPITPITPIYNKYKLQTIYTIKLDYFMIMNSNKIVILNQINTLTIDCF